MGEENLCVGKRCWAYREPEQCLWGAAAGERRDGDVAASSQNEGQAEQTDEQKGKLLAAQGTTMVLPLTRLHSHFFFCPLLKSFQQPHP